jgi:hypothetical protein
LAETRQLKIVELLRPSIRPTSPRIYEDEVIARPPWRRDLASWAMKTLWEDVILVLLVSSKGEIEGFLDNYTFVRRARMTKLQHPMFFDDEIRSETLENMRRQDTAMLFSHDGDPLWLVRRFGPVAEEESDRR